MTGRKSEIELRGGIADFYGVPDGKPIPHEEMLHHVVMVLYRVSQELEELRAEIVNLQNAGD